MSQKSSLHGLFLKCSILYFILRINYRSQFQNGRTPEPKVEVEGEEMYSLFLLLLIDCPKKEEEEKNKNKMTITN